MPKINFDLDNGGERGDLQPDNPSIYCSLCGTPDKAIEALDCDWCEKHYEEEVAKYIKAMQEAGEEYK